MPVAKLSFFDVQSTRETTSESLIARYHWEALYYWLLRDGELPPLQLLSIEVPMDALIDRDAGTMGPVSTSAGNFVEVQFGVVAPT